MDTKSFKEIVKKFNLERVVYTGRNSVLVGSVNHIGRFPEISDLVDALETAKDIVGEFGGDFGFDHPVKLYNANNGRIVVVNTTYNRAYSGPKHNGIMEIYIGEYNTKLEEELEKQGFKPHSNLYVPLSNSGLYRYKHLWKQY